MHDHGLFYDLPPRMELGGMNRLPNSLIVAYLDAQKCEESADTLIGSDLTVPELIEIYRVDAV